VNDSFGCSRICAGEFSLYVMLLAMYASYRWNQVTLQIHWCAMHAAQSVCWLERHNVNLYVRV